MNEKYPDLPDWVTEGAELAELNYRDSAMPVVITKVTRTQIVAAWKDRPDMVRRYKREPAAGSFPAHAGGLAFALIGPSRRGAYLVQPGHPSVVALRISRAALQASHDADGAWGEYRKVRAPGDQEALDLCDAIENAARAARRQIMDLIAKRTVTEE